MLGMYKKILNKVTENLLNIVFFFKYFLNRNELCNVTTSNLQNDITKSFNVSATFELSQKSLSSATN